MKVFKTKAGTELPLMDLRGKDYLQVAFRIVWFREEHPDWSIETEFLTRTTEEAVAIARLKDEKGRIMATAHKSETREGFFDFLEKAETGAIGRALMLVGYGTAFCADELDEGTRLADSPLAPKDPPIATESPVAAKTTWSQPQKKWAPQLGAPTPSPIKPKQGASNKSVPMNPFAEGEDIVL